MVVTVDPTVTAGWIGAAAGVIGGLLGGVVGGGIAYRAAVKSLNKAAAQAETAQQAEWAEAHRVQQSEWAEDQRKREDEREQACRAALLALSWELEVNQELLERQVHDRLEDSPPLLLHLALDAASRRRRASEVIAGSLGSGSWSLGIPTA